MKKHVIIVAGGSGKRMNADIPKQFLIIKGKPILFHTIKCFDQYLPGISIILVLPEPYIDYWKSIMKKIEPNINHVIVVGGRSRFHSVKNGLDKISDPGLIAIHDGVRPMVSSETMQRVFLKAETDGNAIPAIRISESLREVRGEDSKPIYRDNYRLIQTPQCFHSELIKRAYNQEYTGSYTDDASVVEKMGVKINLVEGNPENIKITRPSDLKFAKVFLK